MRGVEAYNIIGGKAADTITGYRLTDYLDGGAGSDVLHGNAGNDFVMGGAGDDKLFGDQNDDIVQGGAGADAIAGGSGNDVLFSDAAGDTGVEIDKLNGGEGDDYVFIGMKDIGDGGNGVDRLHLDFTKSTIAETFVFGASNSFATGGLAKNFETLEFDGGSGKDAVTGGALSDSLNGNGGDDTLIGGKGSDVIDGGAGNDLVRGGDDADVLTDSAGADKLYGDGGDDIFMADRTNANRDIFIGGDGTDTVIFAEDADYSVYLDLTDPTKNDGLAKGDSFGSIEIFHGTDLDDFMFGSAATDTFYGEGGDDVLNGRDGNDRLVGGGGSNTLTGGAGQDVFVLGTAIDDIGGLGSYWKGDVVTDLKQGEDKIEIALEDFGLDGAGDFKLVVGANPVAAGNAAAFLYDTATDRLWFDADGAGGDHEAMLIATFENDVTLKASDFVLV
jgi:Ca2+-binding RTX toxin-like protein